MQRAHLEGQDAGRGVAADHDVVGPHAREDAADHDVGVQGGAGLLLVLPAITALLVVNIAFGVMTRAAPQLNVFAIGFPITIAIGAVALYLSLPLLVPHIEAMLADMTRFFLKLMQVYGA